MPASTSAWCVRVIRVLAATFAFGCACFAVGWARAESPGTCTFDLPEGMAEKTLKAFSEQSGRSLIVAASAAAGIRTNAVRGEYTPSEALGRMLAGTGLVAIEDPKNGAFSVRREGDGEAQPRRNPEGAVNGIGARAVYTLPFPTPQERISAPKP